MRFGEVCLVIVVVALLVHQWLEQKSDQQFDCWEKVLRIRIGFVVRFTWTTLRVEVEDLEL